MVIANGETPLIEGLTQQRVPCGAAVLLDDKVMKHGIVLVHPDLPLFQLFLELDPKTKMIKHRFELIKPKSKLVKDFAIEIVDAEPAVVQPERPLIITH